MAMRIRSESFQPGHRIPAEFAAGKRDGEQVGFGGNLNPHLAWDDVPGSAKSLVLLCIDSDAPTRPEMAGKEGVEIPVDQPRTDFIHWAMIDIPPTLRELHAGQCSDGVVPHGKQAPDGPAGTRQGLNDYTGWFEGDDHMAGKWFGYDGPFPPPNDLRLHRYFFRLFALDIERLPVDGDFTAGDVFAAMQGHVLAEALVQGSYSLNPAVKD